MSPPLFTAKPISYLFFCYMDPVRIYEKYADARANDCQITCNTIRLHASIISVSLFNFLLQGWLLYKIHRDSSLNKMLCKKAGQPKGENAANVQ